MNMVMGTCADVYSILRKVHVYTKLIKRVTGLPDRYKVKCLQGRQLHSFLHEQHAGSSKRTPGADKNSRYRPISTSRVTNLCTVLVYFVVENETSSHCLFFTSFTMDGLARINQHSDLRGLPFIMARGGHEKIGGGLKISPGI